MGVTCDQARQTTNGVQMCSLTRVAHVALCVTVVIVHIGYDEVLVVIQFCVAIFVVIFCIRRCTLYRFQERSSQALPNSKDLSV